MDKNECLELLDKIETTRRKITANPDRMTKDFIFRYIEALLAEKAGFENRAEWSTALLQDHRTEFAKFHHFYPNVDLENGVAYPGYHIPQKGENI